MFYEVKREITLIVEADNRADAIKSAKDWGGETWSASTHHGVKEWDGKSKLLTAKKTKPPEPEEDLDEIVFA